MILSYPDLKNKVINAELHKYLSEIQTTLFSIKETKNEFIKWWNYETNQASEISRNCRNEFKTRRISPTSLSLERSPPIASNSSKK